MSCIPDSSQHGRIACAMCDRFKGLERSICVDELMPTRVPHVAACKESTCTLLCSADLYLAGTTEVNSSIRTHTELCTTAAGICNGEDNDPLYKSDPGALSPPIGTNCYK